MPNYATMEVPNTRTSIEKMVGAVKTVTVRIRKNRLERKVSKNMGRTTS